MNQANEYPYCPTTSLVLVLDDGFQQERHGVSWHNDCPIAHKLELFGIEWVRQSINEPGWEFTVKFLDAGNSSLAGMKTNWDESTADPSILYATSTVDYHRDIRELVLTTHVMPQTRVIWRKWTIEMRTRAPKWRNETERQADMAAHERAFPSTTRLPIGVGNDFSARRVALDGNEETFLQKEENRKR